jgi:YgiT-type zinc finger domain-containing protein
MSTEDRLICDVCAKGNARIRRITRAYGKGDDLLLIEDVPVISCPDCGESYLTAETLHQIDQIKQERKRFAVERFVEVARLG